jgi:hypothetical protein
MTSCRFLIPFFIIASTWHTLRLSVDKKKMMISDQARVYKFKVGLLLLLYSAAMV